MFRLLQIVVLGWCLIASGEARQEKTVEECDRNVADSLKSRICDLRQYTPIDSPDMDKHMQCVLEVVGFVEPNGEVSFQELLGVLKMVDPNMDHAANIKKCNSVAEKVNESKKANTFYMCFLGTGSVSAFKYGVDYVELIKAGKMQEGTAFDASLVRKLIKEIDDGLCN